MEPEKGGDWWLTATTDSKGDMSSRNAVKLNMDETSSMESGNRRSGRYRAVKTACEGR